MVPPLYRVSKAHPTPDAAYVAAAVGGRTGECDDVVANGGTASPRTTILVCAIILPRSPGSRAKWSPR